MLYDFSKCFDLSALFVPEAGGEVQRRLSVSIGLIWHKPALQQQREDLSFPVSRRRLAKCQLRGHMPLVRLCSEKG